MTVYLINILLLMLEAYWLLVESRQNLKNPKKVFCGLASIQWILISGLRGLSIGADTEVYKDWFFERRKLIPWSEVWSDFTENFWGTGDLKDPGYPLLEKTFQIFSESYQVWLFFIAIVFMVCMGIWIYKNSPSPLVSYLLFSCLFYSFFAITGHRQTLATALTVFVGSFLIKKRKFVPFILITILMSTVHKSALVIIPFYFLYNKRITKLYTLVIFVCFVAFFVFNEPLLKLLANMFGYENYENIYDAGGANTFTLMYLLVIFVGLWRKPQILKKYPEATMAFNALFIGMVFIPIVYVNPSVMRVVQYFSVYLMLMVPYIINSFKDIKERRVVVGIVVIVLILLFISTNPQYKFFWQE